MPKLGGQFTHTHRELLYFCNIDPRTQVAKLHDSGYACVLTHEIESTTMTKLMDQFIFSTLHDVVDTEVPVNSSVESGHVDWGTSTVVDHLRTKCDDFLEFIKITVRFYSVLSLSLNLSI